VEVPQLRLGGTPSRRYGQSASASRASTMMVLVTLRVAWRKRRRPHRAVAALFLLAAIGFSVAAVVAHKWWEIQLHWSWPSVSSY
jgi:hypothetical protein